MTLILILNQISGDFDELKYFENTNQFICDRFDKIVWNRHSKYFCEI